MQSDAVTKQRFQLRFQASAQLLHSGNEIQRGAKSAIGRVRLRIGSAPVAKKLVAQKMFHAPVFREDGAGLRFEDLVQKLEHSGWAEQLGYGRRVVLVREEHG